MNYLRFSRVYTGSWRKKVDVFSPPIGIIEKNILENKSISGVDRKIGFIFEGDIEPDNAFKIGKIKEPNFENTLVAIHKGSYKTLNKTYSKVFEYLDKNNLKFKPPYREIYLSVELDGKDGNIEIQIPVEKSSNH